MWIELLILALAVPLGYFVAYLTRDEIKEGRKYFRAVIIAGILLAIWGYLTKSYDLSWIGAFIAVFSSISLVKSSDKKWIKT